MFSGQTVTQVTRQADKQEPGRTGENPMTSRQHTSSNRFSMTLVTALTISLMGCYAADGIVAPGNPTLGGPGGSGTSDLFGGDDGNGNADDSTAEDFDWGTVDEPEEADGVVVVEEHPCFESIQETYELSMEEMVITFQCDPENVGLEVGDIIVGTANGGYLREITSMETSGYVIVAQTVQASLEQVMVDGGFYQDIDFEGGRYTIDKSGTVLYDGNHGGVDVNVQLSEAVLDIRPRLRMGAQFGWFKLKRADAILDLDIEADIELMAQLHDEVSVDGEIGLGSYSYPFAFAAGPIPVTGTLEISLTAGFETSAEATATATVGAEADADITLGGRYRNGSWYYVSDNDFDAHRTGPDFDLQGDWDGRVWVRAEARVMLYRVAGPSFGVRPFVRGEAHAECSDLDWEFWAGAQADAGLHLDVLVFELSKNFGPRTGETSIGDGTIELPFPIGTDCPGGPAPCPEPIGTISCGQVVSGNTSLDADGIASMGWYPVNVGNYEAPEVVFEWAGGGAPEVEFKFVDPSPTQINHDIMIIEAPSVAECSSDKAVDWGLNSVMFEPGGGPYYIVVDGYDGDAGEFQLTLDCDP